MSTDVHQSKHPIPIGLAEKGKQSRPWHLPFDPFIVATDQDSIKPDAASRKLIRHHVMKGKKRKRTIRPQRILGSWINHDSEPDPDPSHEHDQDQDHDHNGPAAPSADSQPTTRLAPQMTPSTQSFVSFSMHAEPFNVRVIYDFVSLMTRAMYPVERCVDACTAEQGWLENLSHDPIYADTVLYFARAHNRVFRNPCLAAPVLVFMNEAITMLQKKLSDPSQVIEDSTVFAVLALTMASEILEGMETAGKHASGLRQLIKLRGGIATLAHKRPLQFKCCRFDLRYALAAGSQPLFFADGISWKAYLARPEKAPKTTPINVVCKVPDIRLVNVWLDLREFTTAVNLAHQTQRQMPVDVFQEAMISVQYRLQYLSYGDQDKQEVLRVGMLAFSTSAFLEVHGPPAEFQGHTTEYPGLAEKLYRALRLIKEHTDAASLRLTLWVILIGRISMSHALEYSSWLDNLWRRTSQGLNLASWTETREVMKSFLWLDEVHDEVGKRLFDRAQGRDN